MESINSENTSVASLSLIKGVLKEDTKGSLGVDNETLSADVPAIEAAHKRATGEKEKIDFLKDDKKEMTWGRRIALSLMDKKWYNPRAGEAVDDDAASTPTTIEDLLKSKSKSQRLLYMTEVKELERPSLAKAWAYFEHVALDRYIVEPKTKPPTGNIFLRIIHKFQKGDKKLEKAEPGDNSTKTMLYSPVFTPHAQLGDFGLGVGLYFATLRGITIITFIAGLVSLYNIFYFASDNYMDSEYRLEVPSLIQGSAVCTMTSWVPCPTCNCTDEELRQRESLNILFADRCGDAYDPLNPESESFVVALRNDCDGTAWQLGVVNYVTVIFLLLGIVYLGIYLERQEIKFDEDEQTAQDYSIRINNPPSDANDPEEWRKFFENAFEDVHVTVLTVAVDNDFLVRTLVERRELLRTIENMLEPGTSMDNLHLAFLAAKAEQDRNWFGRFIALLAPGLPELYAKVVALNAKVQGLAQLDFPVTNIFIIFETEKAQRTVLEKLSVGSMSAYKNDDKALSHPKYLFRGKHVLDVSEPDEPSTIRWQDLNAGFVQKVKEQAITIFCTLGAIIGVAVVVKIANDASPIGAAIAISTFNAAFPVFAKILTDLEAHAAEGDKQTSLYFKIAAFRWVNTAIVITIITPFTNTLSLQNGLIPQIYTLFFAEIVTTNAIQLADPMGHINRHILAPRAATQDAMNLKFQGQEFELAERYTDMTKLLFLCLWYSSIYPGSFFMCSFALLIKYFVDRFSLMRTWKRPPQLGTGVSEFSRRYFFSLANVAMAVISSYYWSGFPYDNLCPNDDIADSRVGTFTVIPRNTAQSSGGNVTYTNKDVDYRFCLQDLLTPGTGQTFPFIPSNQPEGGEWMNDEQEWVTLVFGWSAVGISAIVILKFLWGWVVLAKGLFSSSYEAVGDDQNKPFSTVAARNAYIPEVNSYLFAYPLIACNSDHIDPELYEWNDPDRPFSYYDLTKDADMLLDGMDFKENVGFSVVKHWPPEIEDESSASTEFFDVNRSLHTLSQKIIE